MVGRSKTGPPSVFVPALATGADPPEQLHHPAWLGMGPGGDAGEDRAAEAFPGAHHTPLDRVPRPAEADLTSLVELDPDVGGRLAGRVVAEVEVGLLDPGDPHPAEQSQVEVVIGGVDVLL